MANLKIELSIPNGEVINLDDSNSIIKDLNGQINHFSLTTSINKAVKPTSTAPEDAQGTLEFAKWVIENIDKYPDAFEALYTFLFFISMWAKKKLSNGKGDNKKPKKKEGKKPKKKEGKKPKKKEGKKPKIIIEISGYKLELPADKVEIKNFLNNFK